MTPTWRVLIPALPSAPMTARATTVEPSASVTVADSWSWAIDRAWTFCRTSAPASTAAAYQALSKSVRRTMVNSGRPVACRVKACRPASLNVMAEIWS